MDGDGLVHMWLLPMRASLQRVADEVGYHLRIFMALLLRELSTRYGRDNIGFLWLIAEPMIFCSGVSALWAMIKPAYEGGIRIVAFTVTGYMGILLIRQTVSFTVNAIRVNEPLLYHRNITPLHLFFARFAIEFLGVSLAYIVIVFSYVFLGLMNFPVDLSMTVEAWLILGWFSFGLALIMGVLGTLFEFVERFISIITYITVPISGAFYMVSTLPPRARLWALYIPMVHCFEYMRAGFFGEFVTTYHYLPYTISWAAGLTLFGLILVSFVRERFEVQ